MALVDRGEGARIALRRKAGEPPVAQHAQRGTTAACRAERNHIRRSHCSPIGRKLELLSTFLDERSNCDRSNSSSRGGTERFVGQERLRRGRGFAGEGSGGSRSGPVGLRRGPARVDLEGYTVIADKGFAGEDFERLMSELRAIFRRPDRKGEQPRFGGLGGVRQWIESIIDSIKGQLSLERHGAHTMDGLIVRVAGRVLALAAGIWHNWNVGDPGRHLTAYDH